MTAKQTLDVCMKHALDNLAEAESLVDQARKTTNDLQSDKLERLAHMRITLARAYKDVYDTATYGVEVEESERLLEFGNKLEKMRFPQ